VRGSRNVRLVGCGKAVRSLLRLSIITTFETDCDELSSVFPETSGVMYRLEKFGSLLSVIGNPIAGI